jgi:uncharacterized phiE125 gp8 family phage protein
MVYKLITPPSGLVSDIETLKSQIGLFHNEKDAALVSYLKAATELAERFTGRQLLTATWEFRLPYWFYKVCLKKCPVTQIVSVKYYDLKNELQEIDLTDIDQIAYDLAAEPAVIWFHNRFHTCERPDAFQIRFQCGYGEGNIPEGILNAITLMVGKMIENPADTVESLPKASTNILRNYRI